MRIDEFHRRITNADSRLFRALAKLRHEEVEDSIQRFSPWPAVRRAVAELEPWTLALTVSRRADSPSP